MVLLVIAAELLFVVLILALLTRAPSGMLGHSSQLSEARADWREAHERAERLLEQLLTPREYQTLQRRGYLEFPVAFTRAGRTASHVTTAR